MRVILCGGGTGGHVYPAIAVGRRFHGIGDTHTADLLFVGSQSGYEQGLIEPLGWSYEGIPAGKYRRAISIQGAKAIVQLLRGYARSRKIISQFRPDVVLGTGGYVTASMAMAAGQSRIPLVILNPDSVAGASNRFAARWAAKVCLWLGDGSGFAPNQRVVTGLPVRSSVVSDLSPAQARLRLGFDPQKPLCLVIGGSQGARALNERVAASVEHLMSEMSVLHQIGENNSDQSAVLSVSHVDYRTVPYINEVDLSVAYAAADILICRCGVGMLAEGTVNGLPLIMVPLPTAHSDHQTRNALEVQRKGAGILLTQSDVTGASLAKSIDLILNDDTQMLRMAAASKELGPRDAAARVVDVLQSVVTGTSSHSKA